MHEQMKSMLITNDSNKMWQEFINRTVTDIFYPTIW